MQAATGFAGSSSAFFVFWGRHFVGLGANLSMKPIIFRLPIFLMADNRQGKQSWLIIGFFHFFLHFIFISSLYQIFFHQVFIIAGYCFTNSLCNSSAGFFSWVLEVFRVCHILVFEFIHGPFATLNDLNENLRLVVRGIVQQLLIWMCFCLANCFAKSAWSSSSLFQQISSAF